jgi:uncharacterized tellurite resistance protein B-like protein
MEADDRATCLEALAAFAWADGAVDDTERKRIHDFLEGASDLSSQQIDQLFNAVRELSTELLSRISSLSAERVCELLAVADAMCYAEHAPTAGEINLLRRIGVAKFGERNGQRIFGWLEHQRQANVLLDELLEGNLAENT